MAVDGLGHPVAGAVDVDDLAGLGQAVYRGKIDRGLAGFLPHLGAGPSFCGLPVPKNGVLFPQLFQQAHLLQGHRPAEAHGGVLDPAAQIVRRLVRRVKHADLIAQGFQILGNLGEHRISSL